MARSPRPLAGRVVAITGAARGIGRATAEACVRAGMRVAIGDLDLAAAQRTAAEIGHGTIAVELDVCDRALVARFLDEVEARLGPLDVLVNNAGIMQLGRLVDEDDATARRQVDINVHGVLHGMKEALPRMLARNAGHVVNMASTAGKAGFAGGATYSGTKHFVVGMSEATRFELRGSGVEISCVMPGIVKTELATGLPQARFVKHTEPDAVAAAIVEVLRVPRFDVFVPRALGPLTRIAGVLPRPAREAMARVLKADRVLDLPDGRVRSDYERRATRSGEGLPADEEPERLPASSEP
jgi:NADP-dependent 3-hydroxy acid dehydrogenase YdfG